MAQESVMIKRPDLFTAIAYMAVTSAVTGVGFFY